MHMFSILLATGNYKTIHVKMSDSIKNSGKPLSWEPSLAHITAFFLDLVWPTCGQLAKCGFRYAPGWALSEMFIMIFFFFSSAACWCNHLPLWVFVFCLNMGKQILLSTGGESTYSQKARGEGLTKCVLLGWEGCGPHVTLFIRGGRAVSFTNLFIA